MNKYTNLFKNIIFFAIGSLGSKLILFFLVPLYTNYLSAEEYGTVELVDTFANLIMPVVSIVIFDAVLRYSLNNDKNRQNVILIATLVLAVGTIFTVIFTPLVGLYPGMKEWQWFIALYVIGYMFDQTYLTYLKAKDKMKTFVFLGLLQTVILAVLNILLLVVFKVGIFGFLVSNISAHLFIAALAFILGHVGSDLRHSKFDRKLFKEMMLYSLPLIVNNLAWWIIQSSDKIMLDLLVSSAAVGLYTVASKIPALVNVIISFFTQAWNIASIKEYDDEQDQNFYTTTFNLYCFSLVTFCILIFFILKPFMSIYVSDEFYEAWKFVPGLLTSAVFCAISAFFGIIYSTVKKNTGVMISTFLSAAINIGLNFLLIPYLGLYGAVIATICAYFFIAVYRLFDSRRLFKFKINFPLLILEMLILIVNCYVVTIDFYALAFTGGSLFLVLILNWKSILKIFQLVKKVINSKRKSS